MLYLGDHVISESCYKMTILQWNNSFVIFHGKKVGSHNMTMLSSGIKGLHCTLYNTK